MKKSYQIAAKTGTVGGRNGNSDAIVAGYTTEHTFVVWYRGEFGNDMCGANAPCKFAAELLDDVYRDKLPSNFTPPNDVIKLKVDENSLAKHQQLKIAKYGAEFWFDVANKPTQKADRITYNYIIDVKNCKNGIYLQLPDIPNGNWELFMLDNNNWKSMQLANNSYNYDSQSNSSFYAKLYIDGEFAYQTPIVEVCPSNNEHTNEQSTKKKSWLDFWYW